MSNALGTREEAKEYMQPVKPTYGDTLFPVIVTVPLEYQTLTGRDKVLSLSRHARRALEISATQSGVVLRDLDKDSNGAPLPCDGHNWSLTHKPDYVAGVVAPARIGIDLEKIRPCKQPLFRKIADDREWGLTDTEPFKLFFRYWTSKEAVLKAAGTGLRDLSKCHIAEVIDDHHLTVNYRDTQALVEHFYFDGHIASIVKNGLRIKWTLLRFTG